MNPLLQIGQNVGSREDLPNSAPTTVFLVKPPTPESIGGEEIETPWECLGSGPLGSHEGGYRALIRLFFGWCSTSASPSASMTGGT